LQQAQDSNNQFTLYQFWFSFYFELVNVQEKEILVYLADSWKKNAECSKFTHQSSLEITYVFDKIIVCAKHGMKL